MPLVQRLFSFENFSFFLGKDLEILKKKKIEFFFFFKIYIHKQSSLNVTWNFWIQENIENGINKQTLSLTMMLQTICRVRQSWATCFFLVHLGCLSLGVLEPWLWWNGLCLKWLDHTLGRHASCELLAFDVDHAYTLSMGSSVGFRLIQETILGFHFK